MIPEPIHGRSLVVGGVSLVKFRFPKVWHPIVDRLRDCYEQHLRALSYFANTPFTWVNMVIRYGTKTQETPVLMRVSRRFGELQLSIEVDVAELLGRSDEEVQDALSHAISNALNAVGTKYNTPKVMQLPR